MGKKEFGVNSKKEEAKERKDTQKKEKKEKEERVKEDAKWVDNDKKAAKKADKDKEEREKMEAKQRAKDEKKTLLEAEEAELSKSKMGLFLEKNPPVPKKTKYEIDKYKNKLEEESEKKHTQIENQKVKLDHLEYDS